MPPTGSVKVFRRHYNASPFSSGEGPGMRPPYINIHTHHASPDHGVFVFNNRFAHDPAYHTASLFSIGVHPWDAGLVSASYLHNLKELLTHTNCFALGECGLDRLHGPDWLLQKTVFRGQLELAVACSKPVIIHCVKAFDELLELAGPYAQKVPLVIHGFHKSSQMAAQLISKGFYLSLNPALFGRSGYDSSVIPLQRLFLETDTREDLSIAEVYSAAAAWFNVAEDELKERINGNFETLKQKIA